MKVCVVGLRGFPGVIGGVETHCEQLYPRLAAADEALDITVIARSPYVREKRRVGGVSVVPVWTIRNKYFEAVIHTLLAVVYARLRVNAKVLHIHGIGPALFTPLARMLGMRVVVTHHGADYNRSKWNVIAREVLRFGELMSVLFANRVIVVGESLCSALRKDHPVFADKIIHVPNGAILPKVDEGGENSTVLSELGLTEGQYVLSVGRLVPEKGFHDLITAHEGANDNSKLVIVGDATHADKHVSELLARGSSNVIFAGFRQGRDLVELYQNARMFVLPSYHEGLPISALEAMSAGAPVLLSDIDPNRDMGLPQEAYFPVGDTQALADRLSASAVSLGRAAYDEIMKKFAWDRVAARTLALYEGLASAPAAATASDGFADGAGRDAQEAA
ncbi:MAG: glycosyltransferase family 4 protein [Pseudomonadota bacterium]